MSLLRIAIITTLGFGAGAIKAQAAFNFFDPMSSDSIPKLISGTGMYKNMATKEIGPDVIPFEVNSPLWTDGAVKQRYIAVPAGKSVIYDDSADIYKYPDRAMVIKNFSVDTIPGNPASRILFETRFSGVRLVGGKEKWFLWSYHWRLDQTDADLVADSGSNATVRVYRNGVGQAPFMKKWRFPGKLQCAACHRVQGDGGRTVLAFFTAQLNKPLTANPALNQLDHLFNLGILKTADGKRPDFSRSPKWANWADTTASLELRSRSYIAANCSGCHGDRGIETNAALGVTLNYDFHDMQPHMDFLTKRLQGVFPVDSGALVVPGRPDRSVIVYRQKMRNEKDLDFAAERMAMPPLGSFEPDTNAIKVISAWIASMPGTAIHAGALSRARTTARVRGTLLEIANLPAEAVTGIGLVDFRGAAIGLTRLQPGIYRIDGPMPSGIYFLTAHGKVLQRIIR